MLLHFKTKQRKPTVSSVTLVKSHCFNTFPYATGNFTDCPSDCPNGLKLKYKFKHLKLKPLIFYPESSSSENLSLLTYKVISVSFLTFVFNVLMNTWDLDYNKLFPRPSGFEKCAIKPLAFSIILIHQSYPFSTGLSRWMHEFLSF